MRVGIWILTFAAAVTLALGQEVPDPGEQGRSPQAGLCTLEGTLVSATNGVAVRRMSLTLRGGSQSYGAESDGNGHFVFMGVMPGGYRLAAGGGRFPLQTYGDMRGRERGKILTCKPGEHLRDIAFRLTPGGVITGTIYNQDGDPVVGGKVRVLLAHRVGDQARVESAKGGGTDDRGQYRVFGLAPGHYFVVASGHEDGQDANAPSDLVELPTFFPDTADPSQASTVDVGPGGEVDDIDITLTQMRGARLRGRVALEGTGGIPRQSYVSLLPRSPRVPTGLYRNMGATTQDDQGNFQISDVPPGSYILMSYWSNQNMTYFGSVPVDVTGTDMDGITLTLARGARITGRFRTEHGTPINFSALNVWLLPSNTAALAGGSARIRPDGAFVIDDIYDGAYQLHVAGFPEEYYVKSAQLGGLDALGTDVTINHSQPPGPLEILLSTDGGRIDGTVLNDDKPVPGATVALVPNPPNRDREDMYSHKQTDEMGRFSLMGLAPGDYKLFAWPGEAQVNWRDPDTLRIYEQSGTPVRIEEKKQEDIQLLLLAPQEEAE